MPCYDHRSSPEYIREEYRHNSPVAEMLCDVIKRLTPEQIKSLPDTTKIWWTEHRERDRKKDATENY